MNTACLIIALIFAILVFLNVSSPRFNLVGACLFFFILAFLLVGVNVENWHLPHFTR